MATESRLGRKVHIMPRGIERHVSPHFTVGWSEKFYDQFMTALRKSGLPIGSVQRMLESSQGKILANEFVELVREYTLMPGDDGIHEKCGRPIRNGKCTHCD